MEHHNRIGKEGTINPIISKQTVAEANQMATYWASGVRKNIPMVQGNFCSERRRARTSLRSSPVPPRSRFRNTVMLHVVPYLLVGVPFPRVGR